MVWLLTSLPVLSFIVIVLFGFGIAMSTGFREVLLGLKEKSEFKLLNLFSVEGVSAVVIIGMILGTGVVYPISALSDLFDIQDLKSQLGRVKADAAATREKLEKFLNPKPWQIKGRFKLPENFTTTFRGRDDAEDFWWQGKWAVFHSESIQYRQFPHRYDVTPLRQQEEMASFVIEIDLPSDLMPWDHIEAIKYEHIGANLEVNIVFSGPNKSTWNKVGGFLVEFKELHLRQLTPVKSAQLFVEP